MTRLCPYHAIYWYIYNIYIYTYTYTYIYTYFIVIYIYIHLFIVPIIFSWYPRPVAKAPAAGARATAATTPRPVPSARWRRRSATGSSGAMSVAPCAGNQEPVVGKSWGKHIGETGGDGGIKMGVKRYMMGVRYCLIIGICLGYYGVYYSGLPLRIL